MARPATYAELRSLMSYGIVEQLPKEVVACSLPRVDEDEEPYIKAQVRKQHLETCPKEATFKYRGEKITVRLEVLEHDGAVDRDYEGSIW